MEFLFNMLKVFGIVFVVHFFIWPQILKMYYLPRFKSLCRKYEGKFRLLTSAEKIQILQATRMPLINGINADIEDAFKSEDPNRAMIADVHRESLDHVMSKVPEFEKLSSTELDIAFYKELLSHWEAMTFAQDYDFEGTIEELEHAFNNRDELAMAFATEKGSA